MVQFVITPDTAQQLEHRKEALEREMARLRDEHIRVTRQLEAIPLFLADANGSVSAAMTTPEPMVAKVAAKIGPETAAGMSVPMAIRFVLQKRGRMSAMGIREAILNEGIPKDRLGTTNSYLYTALGRLMSRQQIQRVRGKYQLPPGVTVQFAPDEEDLKVQAGS